MSRTLRSAEKLVRLEVYDTCFKECQVQNVPYPVVDAEDDATLHLFRKYIRGDRFEEDVRADGKIVAVTGANSGIGKCYCYTAICMRSFSSLSASRTLLQKLFEVPYGNFLPLLPLQRRRK